MTNIQRPTRREILMSPFLLTAAATAGTAVAAAPAGGRILVAFFSRSGNTRVIAGQISRTLGADIFEIVPAQPYPADYFATVDQAQQERERGYAPPLQATVAAMDTYETVYLGFPIWGMTAPPPVRSFLAEHDLSGTTLVLFVTHGGFGLGDSLAVVSRHAPQARLVEGFVMQAPQERQTVERVMEWLDQEESAR
ncbi:flavodoxin [Mesorhizobium onobrychidis]|uniref:Flavodoxin n=1 Tax=Mesorhizobium onobrychidis TaxID=2775404 RepID=A0ABY5R6A9_9HYPH|nr:flavodoxin [Mesorhizobium onobrychidis]UVC17787.1 flavodoxin [Mesorhizobium onobrychidis]